MPFLFVFKKIAIKGWLCIKRRRHCRLPPLAALGKLPLALLAKHVRKAGEAFGGERFPARVFGHAGCGERRFCPVARERKAVIRLFSSVLRRERKAARTVRLYMSASLTGMRFSSKVSFTTALSTFGTG